MRVNSTVSVLPSVNSSNTRVKQVSESSIESSPKSFQNVELPELPEGIEREWLVILYAGGDNNLADDVLRDVNELESVGSRDDVHVVTLIDTGKSTEVPIKGARAFYIKHDRVDMKEFEIDSPVLHSYTSLDMGDPKVLSQFVTEMAKRFPAKHIMVIISSHGYGKDGIIDDETSRDRLTLKELRTALHQIRDELGRSLDVIGFDACEMATLEVAQAVRKYAEYMIASQAPENDDGWPYKRILEYFNSTEEDKPVEVVKNTVNSAHEVSAYIPTLSALKLDNVPKVTEALNKFASRLLLTDTPMSVLYNIAKHTWTSRVGGEYRDIYDFASLIYKDPQITDRALKESAKKLMDAVQETVIANSTASGYFRRAHGLSIYFPIYGKVDERYLSDNGKLLPWFRWLHKLNKYIFENTRR